MFVFLILVISNVLAADETPYDTSGGRPVIIQPGSTNPMGPGKGGTQPRPGAVPTPGAVEAVKTAPPALAPPAPAVVVPPPPQVVTGSGRNYGNVTLRVEPLMIRTKENEIIQQDIILDNPRGVAIDQVEVVLKYSPVSLEAIDMDPASPGINLKPAITPQKNPNLQIVLNQVDPKKGQAFLMIKTLNGNAYIGGKLATIYWTSKKSSFYTPITFSFPLDSKSPGTKVLRQGRDLLGWDFDPNDGVITGGIVISPAPTVGLKEK